MNALRSPKHNPGFTMIEMLTVIAVILILMSILIPAVIGGIERGRRAKCVSNLSQIGKALVMYADANRDYLPQGSQDATYSYWDKALLPYLNENTNVFYCSSDEMGEAVGASPRSYSANGAQQGVQGTAVFPFGRHLMPNSAIRMADLDYNKGDIILVGEWPGDGANPRGAVGSFGFCILNADDGAGKIHQGQTAGNWLMASMAVKYYERSDPALSAKTGTNNLWTVWTQ